MSVIPFPVGGKDFNHGQYRRVSVASVNAYLIISEGHEEIVNSLERAIRIQEDGYCHLEDDIEKAVFRLVGT
jgi:hypothetical protein